MAKKAVLSSPPSAPSRARQSVPIVSSLPTSPQSYTLIFGKTHSLSKCRAKRHLRFRSSAPQVPLRSKLARTFAFSIGLKGCWNWNAKKLRQRVTQAKARRHCPKKFWQVCNLIMSHNFLAPAGRNMKAFYH